VIAKKEICYIKLKLGGNVFKVYCPKKTIKKIANAKKFAVCNFLAKLQSPPDSNRNGKTRHF